MKIEGECLRGKVCYPAEAKPTAAANYRAKLIERRTRRAGS
jgi:hypothetical protein